MIDFFAKIGVFSEAFEEPGVKFAFANDMVKPSKTILFPARINVRRSFGSFRTKS